MRTEQPSGDASEFLDRQTYQALCRVAGGLLQHEREGYALDAADVVHETFIRMVRSALRFQDVRTFVQLRQG